MEFFLDYVAFAAKFLTVVVAILASIIIIIVISSRNRGGGSEQISIKKLNTKLTATADALRENILSEKELKAQRKARKKEKKNATDESRNRMYVLRFQGDIRASAVTNLRQEITAVLQVIEQDDEVFVTVESGGGTIHGYGLAASQLKRIRDNGTALTVSVDKVAASGGYMMACVANKIIAAPFAIIGSIGVLMQLPNFNRLLKENNIDFEMITAGEHKRTVTVFGENTDADREKVREELEEAHDLFKGFIREFRPDVDMATVATGEHWFGSRALELKLVDEIRTSDDYLMEKAKDNDVFEVTYKDKKPWLEKILNQSGDAAVNVIDRLFNRT